MNTSRKELRQGGGTMTARLASSPGIDLTEQAVAFLRPRLDRSLPISERLRTLWAGCLAARDLSAADIIEAEFRILARETGIEKDLGRHADEDLGHVIRWAMLGRNPFG